MYYIFLSTVYCIPTLAVLRLTTSTDAHATVHSKCGYTRLRGKEKKIRFNSQGNSLCFSTFYVTKFTAKHIHVYNNILPEHIYTNGRRKIFVVLHRQLYHTPWSYYTLTLAFARVKCACHIMYRASVACRPYTLYNRILLFILYATMCSIIEFKKINF